MVLSPAVAIAGAIGQVKTNRQLAENQASMMEADAQTARQIGAAQSDISRREGARAVGEAVALQGASGFAMDGSAMDVIAKLAGDYDYQARTARYEAGRTSRRLTAEADVTRIQGRLDQESAYIGAGLQIGRTAASLLTGGGG